MRVLRSDPSPLNGISPMDTPETTLEQFLTALNEFDGYKELKMWLEAWQILENLPKRLQRHPAVLVRKVDVLLALNECKKATILARGITRLWPGIPEAWHRLASVFAQRGKLASARKAVSKYLALNAGRTALLSSSRSGS